MSEEKKDWNAWFAQQKAERDGERVRKLAEAREAAERRGKEPFDRRRFRELHAALNPDEALPDSVWETLLTESEYDYYVGYPDQLTLEEFIRHQRYLDGFA